MAEAAERQVKGNTRETEEIPCSPEVTHRDLNKYCDYCKHNCENCRHVMQKARRIVTEAEEARRKDFEISCYGNHISLCFWSGNRGNQIVVQVDGGEIYVTVTRETWTEWLKGVFVQYYDVFKNVILVFMGAGPEDRISGRPVHDIINRR